MQPRIQANLDGIEIDEWFENTLEGWQRAWRRWNELSVANPASGRVIFEYCGHRAEPEQPCSSVQEISWGDSDVPT